MDYQGLGGHFEEETLLMGGRCPARFSHSVQSIAGCVGESGSERGASDRADAHADSGTDGGTPAAHE